MRNPSGGWWKADGNHVLCRKKTFANFVFVLFAKHSHWFPLVFVRYYQTGIHFTNNTRIALQGREITQENYIFRVDNSCVEISNRLLIGSVAFHIVAPLSVPRPTGFQSPVRTILRLAIPKHALATESIYMLHIQKDSHWGVPPGPRVWAVGFSY